MSDVQSETRAFGLVKTLLVNDNIASRVVDVLVNAANDRLHMGGGVAAALRSKGVTCVVLQSTSCRSPDSATHSRTTGSGSSQVWSLTQHDGRRP